MEENINTLSSKKVVKASLWSFMGEILAKLISPLTFLIMTRLLTPEDFGVVAIASTVLGFINIFSDLGTSKLIIQYDDNQNQNILYNSAFFINIIFGSIIYIAIVIFAGNIANIYGNTSAENVIRVMAIQLVLYALSSVQTAIKKKNLEFSSLFKIRLITVAAPFLISIPIAFLGGGYWALIIGQIVGNFLSTIILWIDSIWKPNITKDAIVFSVKLLKNSIWSTIDQIMDYIPILLDSYLINKYISTDALGLYSTGKNFYSAVESVIITPIIPVLYSTLSIIKSDKNKFKSSVLYAQKVLLFIAFIINLNIYSFRKLVFNIIFNKKWIGVEEVFGLIFLINAFECFISAIQEGYRAKGEFKFIGINKIFYVLITTLLTYIASKHGLIIYVTVRNLSLFLILPIYLIFSEKKLGIKVKNYFISTKNILISSVIYLFFSYICDIKISSNVVNILLKLLIFLIILAMLVLKEKAFVISCIKKIIKEEKFNIIKYKIFNNINKLKKKKWMHQAKILRYKNSIKIKRANAEIGLNEYSKILILIPHSDDEMIGCYNIIKKYNKKVICYYFNFSCNSINNIRRTELENFAKKNSVNIYYSDTLDEKEKEKELYNIIINEKPDLFCVPNIMDWHKEHYKVSSILINALNGFDNNYLNSINILCYQVSVPLLPENITNYISMDKDEQNKKWLNFKIYKSQVNINTDRFRINEIINGNYLNCNAAEVYHIYKAYQEFKKLHEYYDTDKYYNILRKNINNLLRIRKSSAKVKKDIVKKYNR